MVASFLLLFSGPAWGHFGLRRLDGASDGTDFEYFHGGDDWEEDLCHSGRRQSPIDLPFFEGDILSPIPRDFFSKVARFL